MDRKAQGMSLNTIIVAIIVLIVLVVLIMVFTGYFGTRFTPQVTSCANAGGECKFECGFDAFGNAIATLAADCPGSGEGAQVCCSKGLGSGEQKAAADPPNCGSEDVAPCSSGQACKSKGGVDMVVFSGTCKVPVEESATQPICLDIGGTCKSACDTASETQSSSGICEVGAVCCVPMHR